MPRSQPTSNIQSGTNTVVIEEARIINVDMAHWTADVVTKNSQRQLIDLQWAHPYFHFAGGEGIYVMPEVGARVQVCMPSDSSPFILCFLTTFEREATNTSDTTGGAQASLQPEDSESEGNPREVTFRSGRPKMEQGDIMLRTRDGNAIWLHRGGVVEIGATPVSRRFYIPLLNYIRDVCENYEMKSLAGEMSWQVMRADQNPQGDAEALFTLASRNYSQDEFATVMLRVGHVDDSNRLRLTIAPNKINPVSGEVDGEAVFNMEITESGDLTVTVKQDVDVTVDGDLTENVSGSVTQEYGSDHNLTVGGGQSVEVSGSHELEAASSTEKLSSGKTFDCQSFKIGSGASTPIMVLSGAMMAYIQFHTHPSPSGPTGPPNGPPPSNVITSLKGKAE